MRFGLPAASSRWSRQAPELLPAGVLQTQATPDAAAERGGARRGAGARSKAAIASQHHAEQGAGVELRAGQQPQLAEDERVHLLHFVDQEHRTEQRAVEMGQPPLAQALEPVPAIVRPERNTEE